MAHSSPDDRAFLTIIRWPDGLDRSACTALLARTSGLDEATLRMRIGQAPPAILASVPHAQAQRASRSIRSAGGDAFAATLADIESLGETLKVKRLLCFAAGFRAELWSGHTIDFDGSSIEVLIRARVEDRKREKKFDTEPLDHPVDPFSPDF